MRPQATQPDLAVDCCERAPALCPARHSAALVQVHGCLGRAYLGTGHYDDAHNAYEAAIRAADEGSQTELSIVLSRAA